MIIEITKGQAWLLVLLAIVASSAIAHFSYVLGIGIGKRRAYLKILDEIENVQRFVKRVIDESIEAKYIVSQLAPDLAEQLREQFWNEKNQLEKCAMCQIRDGIVYEPLADRMLCWECTTEDITKVEKQS